MTKTDDAPTLSPSRLPAWAKYTIATAGVLLALLLLLLAFAGVMRWAIGDYPTQGQFGDQFGFLNAFLSASALAVLLVTLHLQRLELRQVVEAQEKSGEALADRVEQEQKLARIQNTLRLRDEFRQRIGPEQMAEATKAAVRMFHLEHISMAMLRRRAESKTFNEVVSSRRGESITESSILEKDARAILLVWDVIEEWAPFHSHDLVNTELLSRFRPELIYSHVLLVCRRACEAEYELMMSVSQYAPPIVADIFEIRYGEPLRLLQSLEKYYLSPSAEEGLLVEV